MNISNALGEGDRKTPDDDADLDEIRADRPASTGQDRPPQLFISYRLDPDQALADAVRTLLLSSIEPTPRIYVSGAGGLVPSSRALREQLRDAVQESRAFVAVITEQSKEREWIIYEAGAAWGRRVLYAPVLFDVNPSDLPGTIGDFYAVNSSSQAEIQQLVNVLAETIGARAKSYFGTRFKAFKRAIEEHARASADQEPPWWEQESGHLGAFMQALVKWHAGKVIEAEASFAALRDSIDDHNESAYWSFRWINSTSKGYERLDKARQLPEQFKYTAWYHYMIGEFEVLPEPSISSYRTAIQKSATGSQERHSSCIALIHKLCQTGQRKEAEALLIEGLLDKDRKYRSDVALEFTKHWSESDVYTRLLVTLLGLARPNAAILHACVNIALECKLAAVAVYFGIYLTELDASGSSYNQLGRACEAADIHSEAYQCYEQAMKDGISVARVNIAKLLDTGPNAAAGLQVLCEHAGPWDASSASYPHTTRAKLEDTVQIEKLRKNSLSNRGQEYVARMLALSEAALTCPTDCGNAEGRYLCNQNGSSVSCELQRLSPLPNAYAVLMQGTRWGIAQWGDSGQLLTTELPTGAMSQAKTVMLELKKQE